MKSSISIRAFVFTTLLIFAALVSALGSIGLVPYWVDGTPPTVSRERVLLARLPMLGDVVEAEERATPAVMPERIRIPAVGMDLPISNPERRDVEVLNEALKDGPVRYPGSGRLNEKGNVLVFAHSSQLPVVINQMYRAFNKLSDVKVGDTIYIEGEGKTFTYRVTEVRKTDANEEMINLSPRDGSYLTLSTCDTFGKKSSRWVVEARRTE